jgi:hypothetical protein
VLFRSGFASPERGIGVAEDLDESRKAGVTDLGEGPGNDAISNGRQGKTILDAHLELSFWRPSRVKLERFVLWPLLGENYASRK